MYSHTIFNNNFNIYLIYEWTFGAELLVWSQVSHNFKWLTLKQDEWEDLNK